MKHQTADFQLQHRWATVFQPNPGCAVDLLGGVMADVDVVDPIQEDYETDAADHTDEMCEIDKAHESRKDPMNAIDDVDKTNKINGI